jgi:hypothetical protein
VFQGYLDLKTKNEKSLSDVYSDDGIHLTHTKHGTKRKLTTLFGDVIVKRKSYSQRLQKSVFPLDEQLNLPSDQYADGIRHRVAIEARKSSYDEAIESIMKIENEENNVQHLNVAERNKRVWASIENTAEAVIEAGFLEALQRDPTQQRHWVVLIDGLPHQIKLINRVMKKHNIKATIVMDFIHVLEYVWKAAWCFYEKGDEHVEAWAEKYALKILHGHGNQVAKGMRISATKQGLIKRDNIDKCANYLLKNKHRLQYGDALKKGYPIASGVIEGACRHLINDRLDITGARWSLKGAEAILRLRSLKSSGDFNDYWVFHKKQSSKSVYSEELHPK